MDYPGYLRVRLLTFPASSNTAVGGGREGGGSFDGSSHRSEVGGQKLVVKPCFASQNPETEML